MKTLLHHSKLATTVFILFSLFFVTESSAQLFWNTNGASNTLTATNWGTSGVGPFTTIWTNGSNINFTATSAITNVTNIAVSNLTIPIVQQLLGLPLGHFYQMGLSELLI